MTGFRGRVCFWMTFVAITQTASGQNLKQFERTVTEFTLANGLHFILVERHEAPEISFRTWVDAGSAEDPAGATGLAHMLQRVAYKGTETIGTADWAMEKKALDAVEEASDQLQAERNKGPRADSAKLDILRLELGSAAERAQSYGRSSQFSAILENNGADELKAAASFDHIEFFCNLPSNRVELWFLMESQRLQTPVFRQFYFEREAALGEERTTVESNALGLLMRDLLATAFVAGPFHNPALGWPGDIAELRTEQAREFLEKYFVPANMVMTLVGDLNPEECRKLAERYFGPLRARPAPPQPHIAEPPQLGPRTVELDVPAPPLLAYGFKRPPDTSAEDPVFTVMNLILTGGRTGWLYKQLVETGRLAVDVRGAAAFPSGRFPCLFTLEILPARQHITEDLEKAIDGALADFASQRVDGETLTRAQAMARMAVLRQLDSNGGIAAALPAFYATYGDWRKLFSAVADIDKVSADDVQRVARKYLTPAQRTIAVIAPPAGRSAVR